MKSYTDEVSVVLIDSLGNVFELVDWNDFSINIWVVSMQIKVSEVLKGMFEKFI